MTDLLTRRRLLRLSGGVTAVGLAGCTGTQNDGTGAESDHSGVEDGHDDGGHEEEDGHDDGGHNEAISAPSDTATVRMITQDGGYHFDPHVVRVTVGGTVTWHNESGSHSTTAYHPDNDQPRLIPDDAASWDSGLVSTQGATFEHTFETEGVYHYYCTPHETPGMIGSIIVGEPDPHEQGALADPPASKPDSVREKLEELNGMVNTALGEDH